MFNFQNKYRLFMTDLYSLLCYLYHIVQSTGRVYTSLIHNVYTILPFPKETTK